MSKVPILSIIIPFYNVEQYIEQCLDSVFNQNIEEELYEVICVNDASPDNSRDIVLEYQKRHKNLILIEHEVNKKLGAARNTGRSIARGKYIWNVDSDDYIQPNCLDELLKECEENELDVLMFNYDFLRGDVQSINKTYPFSNTEVYSGMVFLKRYAIGSFNSISQVWSQVYRRKFLDDKNTYSPPINMGEDVPYTFKALLLAENIKSTTSSFYVHRYNEESLTKELRTRPNADRIYENSFVCGRYMADIIPLIPKDENEIREAYVNVVKYIIPLYESFYKEMDRVNRKEFVSLCRKNFYGNYALTNKYLGKKRFFKYCKFLVLGKL